MTLSLVEGHGELMFDDDDDQIIYRVVVNHEEQYSIWPEARPLPLGWSDAGKSGPKAECLAYVDAVWTDMRPLSLRKKMEQMEGEAGEAGATNEGAEG